MSTCINIWYGHNTYSKCNGMIYIAAKLQNGDTALHIAAAMGRRKLTRVLLESGCSQGIKNKVQNSYTND